MVHLPTSVSLQREQLADIFSLPLYASWGVQPGPQSCTSAGGPYRINTPMILPFLCLTTDGNLQDKKNGDDIFLVLQVCTSRHHYLTYGLQLPLVIWTEHSPVSPCILLWIKYDMSYSTSQIVYIYCYVSSSFLWDSKYPEWYYLYRQVHVCRWFYRLTWIIVFSNVLTVF
jgi:hypothetical protein